MKTFVLATALGCFDWCAHWREIKGVQAFTRAYVGCGHSRLDVLPWRVTTVTIINRSRRPLTLYVDGQRAVTTLPPGEVIPIQLRNLTDYSLPMELLAATWDGQKFTHEAQRLIYVSGDYRHGEAWEVTDSLLKELSLPQTLATRPKTELQIRTPVYGWRWNANSLTVINQTSYELVVSRDGRPKLTLSPGGVDYVRLPNISGWNANFVLTAQAQENGRIKAVASHQVQSSGYYDYGQSWTITPETLRPVGQPLTKR